MRSKKPSKQRKALFNAPFHKRQKLMSAPLSESLRSEILEKYGVWVRSFPVRSGDSVIITRGDFKGAEGKIAKVDLKKLRVFVDGITKEKSDGTTYFPAIHPSKIRLIKIDLDDPRRKKKLERKSTKEEEEEELIGEERE